MAFAALNSDGRSSYIFATAPLISADDGPALLWNRQDTTPPGSGSCTCRRIRTLSIACSRIRYKSVVKFQPLSQETVPNSCGMRLISVALMSSSSYTSAG
jgi:hypothetical protein